MNDTLSNVVVLGTYVFQMSLHDSVPTHSWGDIFIPIAVFICVVGEVLRRSMKDYYEQKRIESIQDFIDKTDSHE